MILVQHIVVLQLSLLPHRTCSLCTIFLVQHIVVAPSIIVITSNVQSLYNDFSSTYCSSPIIIVTTSNVQSLYNLFSSTYSSGSQYHCYHFERVVFVQLFISTYISCNWHHCCHFERVVFIHSFQFNIQQLLLVSLLSLRTCSLCTLFLVQHIVVAGSIIVITSDLQSVYNHFSSTYCSCSQYHCYHFERVVSEQSFQYNIQQLQLPSLLSLRTCSLCTIFLLQHIIVATSIIVITSNVKALYNLFSLTYSSCSQYHCYHFERVVFVHSFQFNIQQLLLVSLLSLRTCRLCTIIYFNIYQLQLPSLLSLRT